MKSIKIGLIAALAMCVQYSPAHTAESAGKKSIAERIESGELEARKLSRQEFLALVERRIKAGRLDEALQLVAKLPDTGTWAFDKRFIVARIARMKGDFRTAEKVYRQMLSADPNLHRVRLELARSLFERGNFEAAEYNFRLVLAADVPDSTKRAIQWHLAQMRRNKWWTGTFAFSIVPDSNINTGPSTREVTILGLPFQLNRDSTEQSGVGIEAVLDGDVRPRIAENTRLAVGGRLYVLEYLGKGFDDYNATLRAGPIRTHERGEVGFFGLAGHRWFDSDPYSTSYGARAFGDYDLNTRWNVSGGLTFLDIDVEESDRLDGQFYGANGRLFHTFDDRSTGQVFAQVSRADRNDPVEAYNLFRLGVGYSRELPLGLIGYVSPEVRFRNHDAESAIFHKTREDVLYRAEGRLIFRRLVVEDFAPYISLAYEKNTSTIDINDYSRWRGAFGVTKRF